MSFAQVKQHALPKKLAKEAIIEESTDFLGPRRDASSKETNLLKDLSKIKLIWELPKGDSYSAPVIKGNYLIYAHRQSKDVIAIHCLHPETGKKHWTYKLTSKYEDQFGYGSGPRGTAIINENHVYMHNVSGELICLTLKGGKKVWDINTNKTYNVPQAFFGISSTPVIVDDKIIVNVGAPKGPCVVAFNKKTGKEIWQAGDQWLASYASPIVKTVHGKKRVYVFTGGKTDPPVGGLLSIDPKNGKIDFRFPWRSQNYESVNAATPILFNNKIFISASYRTGGVLLDIQKDFKYKKLWTTKELNAHWTTPVYHKGYIYGIHGRHSRRASLVCLEALTGKKMWEEEITWKAKVDGEEKKLYFGRGSIIKVDGDYLCLSEYGELMWLKLNEKGYEIISQRSLFRAAETWCAPVIFKGILYIVQNKPDLQTGTKARLLVYDLRKE